MKNIIESDPTLDFIINKAEFNYEDLDVQIEIKSSAILLALWKYINHKY